MLFRSTKLKKFNSWWCITCDSDEMTFAGIKQHLRRKHGAGEEIKCTRRGISFLDGKDWYSNAFEVKVGNVELRNEVGGPRAEDDPMRF